MRRTPLGEAVRMTRALADPQRLRILAMLEAGELCVCQVVAVLGLAASTTSRHLAVLAAAGLVDGRKDGRWAYYRRARGGPALRWLGRALRGDPALAADAAALRAIRKQDREELCRQQRSA